VRSVLNPMSAMSKLGFTLYTWMTRVLPAAVQRPIADSAFSRPLKRVLRGDPSRPRSAETDVRWEDLTFSLTAPYHILHKARKNGIENRICRLARSILRSGDAAIDVGANYGFVSLVMGRSVAPNGRVISFEINPKIAKVLLKSIQRNGLGDVIQLIDKGAGSRLSHDFVTVDHILETSHVSRVAFMKIDTDGSDFDVLVGCKRLLENSRPTLVVEMMAHQEEIHAFLCACGYRCFMDQNGKTVAPGYWPANLIASGEPVVIPPRDAFRA